MRMIIRGTTPYHNFILPCLSENITELYITYMQNDLVILDKSIKDEDSDISIINVRDMLENASMEELTEEELSSSQVTIHLTQEDTLAFIFYPAAEKNIAVIQIRFLTNDGEAFASFPIHERIGGVLKNGVIGNEKNSL